jgi:hypothetical protein
MGMYSSFDFEDIEITDLEGLKFFLEEWKKTDFYNEELDNNMLCVNEEGKAYFSFETWNNLKLISYWYDETLIFLNCIAPYIEGRSEEDGITLARTDEPPKELK